MQGILVGGPVGHSHAMRLQPSGVRPSPASLLRSLGYSESATGNDGNGIRLQDMITHPELHRTAVNSSELRRAAGRNTLAADHATPASPRCRDFGAWFWMMRLEDGQDTGAFGHGFGPTSSL